MVDTLAARGKHTQRVLIQDEVHQVEIVAALLDQRAAGIGAEAVPVAHLGIKRLPVLANADLVNLPHGAAMCHANHFGHRRHVTVLLRHPDQRASVLGKLHQFMAVLHPGAQRLFGQDVHRRGKRLAQHLHMGEVGRGHHHGITQAAVEQVLVVLERGRRVGQQFESQRAALDVGVGQRRDLGAGHGLDVFDVFAAHAAATNDAVTNFLQTHDDVRWVKTSVC